MFGTNPFGWPYPGQASPGGATAITDSDGLELAELILSPGLSPTASDTASLSETIAKGFTDSDSLSFADAGSLTDASPQPAPGAETFTLSSTGTIAVAVAMGDSASLVETASPVHSNLAASDSDSASLSEIGSNASGGVAFAFHGVVIAFGNNALDADPTWTRLDDPVGVT